MRRIATCSIALAAVVAVPAQAKPVKAPHAKAAKCTPHAIGYNASGTLVAATLTQTAGADTAERGDDRYSGSVNVDVTKANHGAPTGSQTFEFTDARVKTPDADADGKADAPKAGDRVKLSGKVTRLAKRCDQSAFLPTVTVRKVDVKQPKSADAEPAAEAPAPPA